MGALSNHLHELLRCLESSGLQLPSQDVRIIEVNAGVNRSDGKYHVRKDELRRPSEYENRFDELLQTGYRWLNVSCYGVHEGFLFRLKPPKRGNSWLLTVLYNLRGSPDGDHPTASLVSDGRSNLYSTTEWGGTGQSCQGGCGAVFEVSP